MASVASQLIEEVTAHARSDSLEDAREICADGTYFPNNLRNRDRNMHSAAHIRYSYEMKEESHWGLNSSYSPGWREFKIYTAPLNAVTTVRYTKAGNEWLNMKTDS